MKIFIFNNYYYYAKAKVMLRIEIKQAIYKDVFHTKRSQIKQAFKSKYMHVLLWMFHNALKMPWIFLRWPNMLLTQCHKAEAKAKARATRKHQGNVKQNWLLKVITCKSHVLRQLKFFFFYNTGTEWVNVLASDLYLFRNNWSPAQSRVAIPPPALRESLLSVISMRLLTQPKLLTIRLCYLSCSPNGSGSAVH